MPPVPESVSALVARLSRRVPAHEARILLAHVLGTDLSRLLVADPPDAATVARLEGLVARREAGEPLQHVTGTAPFRTVDLEVGPGVFIPRPETEVVVEVALAVSSGWSMPRSPAKPQQVAVFGTSTLSARFSATRTSDLSSPRCRPEQVG